ncbi:TolC family protein [Oleiharenicola sp. Vm1]|uniref:TolC family protein n=1 Tax=Oleiharenicola sp. Vm1 TaxID=3398393 RepID=UPI0039F5FC18
MKTSSLLLALLLASATASAQSAPPAAAPRSAGDLVAEILAHNPELAVYTAEIDAAQAGLAAAGTRDNPVLSVETGRKRVRDSAGVLAGEGAVWSASVAQTFEWPGRLALRKAVANRDVALAELGLARFRAALAQRTRTLAFSLHAAQERAAATAEVAARYRALRDLFLARDPGGITPLLETRVLEAQELALQRRATDAQLALHAALAELNQLRGSPADAPLAVTDAPPRFAAAPATEALLAAARENNFEFRSAKLELEQQGFAVSLARHERRPSFTVSPYVTQENAGDRERTVGVGFSLPLPVSRRANAGVAAAEARRRQAETAVLVAQRTLEREVLTAVQRYAAKTAEAADWSPEAGKKFREAAELADRHYRLGAVPISTYVELQNSYLEAIDALCQTRLDALEAAGALELLTGTTLVDAEVRP